MSHTSQSEEPIGRSIAQPVAPYKSQSKAFVGQLNRLRWRAKGATLGQGTLIPASTEIINPRGLQIGANVILQRNSTLDCRSTVRKSLVIGKACRLKENVWCAAYGGYIDVGEHVLIGRNSILHGHGGIDIGSWSMMGPGVMILSSEHGHYLSVDRVPFQLQSEAVAPVHIGENVWIGAGVTILPGVTIERDSVIGAGAVVVKSLQSGFVYAGVPAVKVGRIGRSEST